MILGNLTAIGAFWILGWIDTKAGIAFIGVIIGGGIPASVTWLTSRENRKQQWALAALDKRLQIAQEAFTHWVPVKNSVYTDDLQGRLQAAQEWQIENCLYLDEPSRRAFLQSLSAASLHKSLVDESTKPWDDGYVKSIKDNWDRIVSAGQIIMESVDLTGDKIKEQDPRGVK